MKGVAIFFGVLILLFLGIPTLLGSVWATGLSSALLSGGFFTDVSEQVVPQVEQLADESLEIALQSENTSDPEARAWIEAMAQVETPPSEMLRQTGITAWMQRDLANVLQQLDLVLRGEIEIQEVDLDLQPLKQALSSPAMHTYANQVVSQLPACDDQDRASWARLALSQDTNEPVPACNPGPEAVSHVLNTAAAQMPARVEVFESDEQAPVPFKAARFGRAAVWLLFLAPLFFIAVGSLLAGRGAKGFLGWSGGTVLVGGLVALGSSWFAGDMSLSLMKWRAENPGSGEKMWLFDTDEGRKIAAHVGETVQQVAEPLFNPVFMIAAVVAGIGVLLLVLSLVARPAQ